MGVFFTWLTLRALSLFPAVTARTEFNFASLFVLSPTFGITQRILERGLIVAPGQSALSVLPWWWPLTSTVVFAVSMMMLVRTTAEKTAT